jgi:hypothetical protein
VVVSSIITNHREHKGNTKETQRERGIRKAGNQENTNQKSRKKYQDEESQYFLS